MKTEKRSLKTSVMYWGEHCVLTTDSGDYAVVIKRSTGRTVSEYEGENAEREAANYALDLDLKGQQS